MSAPALVELQQPVEVHIPPVSSICSRDKAIHRVSLEIIKQRKEQGLCVDKKQSFTILFTSDTHSNIEPYVASFVSPKPLGGIVRRIQYLEEVRAISSQPVLILDAGDFFQGTPYFEQFEGNAELQFMNLAGYDIITIGNHDFDMGWPHLEKWLQRGQFDAICANVYQEGNGERCLPPYTLLEIGGQFVAIVGIMGMDAWQSIRPSQRKGLEIKNSTEALDEVLSGIRPYVDVVIVLSHSGIREDRELAKHPMVDIIIGGHSHTWMTQQELIKTTFGDGREKVTSVFHGFYNGLLVGKVDVQFDKDRFSQTIASIQYLDEQFDPSQSRALSSVMQTTIDVFKGYQQKMAVFQVPLGECVEALLTKDKALKLIPMGEVFAETLREIGVAHVGVIPSGAMKVGIEPGPFTIGGLHRVLAHAENLWTVTIKGSLLFTLMQSGEERWGKQRNFQYAGVSLMKIGGGVAGATIAGEPLNLKALYRVAGPSFFFEREFMDRDKKVLPKYREEITSIEVKSSDLRDDVAELIKSRGLGRWVVPKDSL